MSSLMSRTAVVLAAHGDRAGDTPNAVLLSQRDALAALASFAHVSAGVLKGEPDLTAALAAAAASGAERIAIYPMFMADGYFTRTVLPDRVTAASVGLPLSVLPPLGLDAGLPALLLREALAATARHGLQPRETQLIVVGHGSKLGPASAEATRAAATAMAREAAFADVVTAFLEEPAFLADVLAADRRPAVVSGFFSGDGLHAGEDVPGAIAASGRRAVYAGSAGASPGLPGLMVTALMAHLGGV